VPAARRAADALALGEHGGLHALPLHPEHLAPLESNPPPLSRTNRTSLVPPLVLIGHAASLTGLTEFIDADREGEAALVMTSPIPRVYELCAELIGQWLQGQ